MGLDRELILSAMMGALALVFLKVVLQMLFGVYDNVVVDNCLSVFAHNVHSEFKIKVVI
jgi:hypothetical protein